MSETIITINACVANLYGDADFNAPVLTQALLGENCTVLDLAEKWVKISQSDGYEGWVNRSFITSGSQIYAGNMFCDDLRSMVYSNSQMTLPLREIIYGNHLHAEKNQDVYSIILPDGTPGWTNCKLRTDRHEASRENLTKIARKFLGIQYYWGGKSPKGFDCSGLIQTVFQSSAVLLPRDSGDQFKYFIESRIDLDQVKPGDLHFFGNNNKVSHVAIATSAHNFIHSQGWVKEESFLSSNPNFNQYLESIYLHSVSISKTLD